MKRITGKEIQAQQQANISPVDAFIGQFASFTIDEKIKAFTVLKSDLTSSIDKEAKATEDRMCFLKDAYGHLIGK